MTASQINSLLVPFALVALWIFAAAVGPSVLAWIRRLRGMDRGKQVRGEITITAA